MDIFCSAGPCGGIHAALFPPSLSLPVTRGVEPKAQAHCGTESKRGDTEKKKVGERGRYCSEEERRANNQGFWMRTRISENTWERTGSITQRQGAAVREEGLPEVLPPLLLLLLLLLLRRMSSDTDS